MSQVSDPAGDVAIARANVSGHPQASFWTLTLGAIGVVYGDIGTSPLYAMRELIAAAVGAGNAANEPAVLGILSLIVWALILVVTVKYVHDPAARRQSRRRRHAGADGAGASRGRCAAARRCILLGIISAALFYGDAILTPALSVLSAVEGLKIVTPAFEPYVVPIAVVILVALVRGAVARHGERCGFVRPDHARLVHRARHRRPVAYFAKSRRAARLRSEHGVGFLLSNRVIGLVTLGAVFLVVTGAEALYADLGHFGRGPIRFAWLFVALPALTINYFGQGALLLANPKAIENPFFLLYPDWALLPMVLLATAATVIASQAVITGAYSLTRQAIQLGLLPRLEIRHTSAAQAGQIYMPRVNWLLLAGVLLLVVLFRSSSALASAYGIAVTGTMVVTAMLAFVVISKVWGWRAWRLRS